MMMVAAAAVAAVFVEMVAAGVVAVAVAFAMGTFLQEKCITDLEYTKKTSHGKLLIIKE